MASSWGCPSYRNKTRQEVFLSLGHKPQGEHTSLSLQRLKDKGRKVVYHKDLIGGGQGRRKEPYQRFPSPEGQSPQVFLPSREGTPECSLSLQLQGEHTSLSLQRTEGQGKEGSLPQGPYWVRTRKEEGTLQRVPSPEGPSPQVFLPSREETPECSLSLQLQGEHTSLSLQRTEGHTH